MTTSTYGPFRAAMPLVLASASPRRNELLRDLGIDFNVLAVKGAEPAPIKNDNPQMYALRAAKAKAEAAAAELDQHQTGNDAVILSADTIVVLPTEEGVNILGKPASPKQALDMLLRLSGRSHTVVTGCCLLWPGTPRRAECFHDAATVGFGSWPEEILRAYIATGESMDKAGAYAIQGMGGFLTNYISGQWSTIVGLPVFSVIKHLLQGGAICPQKRTDINSL